MEQTLGMRTHRPTPYESIPELLPREGFCLWNCAGRQGGVIALESKEEVSVVRIKEEVSAVQGTEGEAQMELLPQAVVVKLPQPSQGCSRTVQHSVPYTTPFQAFPIPCPAARRAFPCYSKEPESPELGSRSAWEEQSKLSPKETGKMRYQESPSPEGHRAESREELLDGA